VKEGIVTIKVYTFKEHYYGLKSIISLQSLEANEENAFYDCMSPYAIFIPRNVTIIERCAFDCCYALREMIFEN
jgi:hypothetical protein